MISATTNTAAFTAARNIDINSNGASASIARMSSGTRITKPSDDAASLSISNKMRAGISSLEQASRNASQGSSLLQVAAGGLEKVGDMLNRMKVLATQVVNGTLGSSEVAYAQQEFGLLLEQIDSTAEQTRFNGISLLTGGASSSVYAHNNKSATGLNSGTGAFQSTLNTAASSGFVQHVFGAAATVKATVKDGLVSLDLDGEIFTASSQVQASGVMVLTSTTTSNNKIAFNVGTGTNISAIDTDSELETELKNLLENATLEIGYAENISSLNTATAAFNNDSAINLTQTSGVIQGSLAATTDITVSGTDGDYSVEMIIDSETFRASSVDVSNGGVLKLTSTRSSGNVLALNFGSDTSSLTDAATFRTALGGLLASATFNVGNSEAAFGLNSTAGGFNGTINTSNTQGFVDGVAQSVSVKRNGDAFDVSLVVGSQTFQAKGFTASDSGQLNLISTTDSANVLSFNLSGTASTAIDTVPELQVGLERLLGLDPTNGANPARFESASASNHEYNGFNMGADSTIKAGAATKAGTYALSYNAESKTFKLTDGVTIYEQKVEKDGNQTVQFANGLTLGLGSTGNNFDWSQNMTQMVFDVGEGQGQSFQFQVSEIPGDDMDIKLTAATTKSLGLTGVSINSAADARAASEAINLAINTVNTGLANIGAQQSRFEFIQSNIATQVENSKAARGTFYDVDMAMEMIDFTKSQTLMQAGVSMMAQANQMPQQLLRLIG